MVVDNRLGRHPGSEFAKYDLDGHARPSDHGLAAHDLRINLDPFVCHGWLQAYPEDIRKIPPYVARLGAHGHRFGVRARRAAVVVPAQIALAGPASYGWSASLPRP